MRRAVPIIVLALLFGATVTVASATTAPRTTIAGRWSGSYDGAFTGTFSLTWKLSGKTLTGTIHLSSPPGTYGINGSVNRSAIKFGTVGAGATYTGKISGNSMSGTYKSPRGTGSWSAHKVVVRTKS